MKIPIQVFINGQLAADCTREHAVASSFGGWFTVRPQAFVCPQCLRVWAVIEGPREQREILSVACERHPEAKASPFNPVPGSILTDFGLCMPDRDLLDSIPRSLLEREFDLHMRYFKWKSQQSRA